MIKHAIADLWFVFSWLQKAYRVVTSGIAASPSVIFCLEFQKFSRRTLICKIFGQFWDRKRKPIYFGSFNFRILVIKCRQVAIKLLVNETAGRGIKIIDRLRRAAISAQVVLWDDPLYWTCQTSGQTASIAAVPLLF